MTGGMVRLSARHWVRAKEAISQRLFKNCREIWHSEKVNNQQETSKLRVFCLALACLGLTRPGLACGRSSVEAGLPGTRDRDRSWPVVTWPGTLPARGLPEQKYRRKKAGRAASPPIDSRRGKRRSAPFGPLRSPSAPFGPLRSSSDRSGPFRSDRRYLSDRNRRGFSRARTQTTWTTRSRGTKQWGQRDDDKDERIATGWLILVEIVWRWVDVVRMKSEWCFRLGWKRSKTISKSWVWWCWNLREKGGLDDNTPQKGEWSFVGDSIAGREDWSELGEGILQAEEQTTVHWYLADAQVSRIYFLIICWNPSDI